MFSKIKPIGDPGSAGVFVEPQDVTLVAHAAITKGGVYCISYTTIDTTLLVFNTTRAVASADFLLTEGLFSSATFVVALDDVASGAKGRFRVSGYADVRVDGGTTDIAVGDLLMGVNAANNLIVAASSGTVTTHRAVAIALEAYTSATVTTKRCYFDGNSVAQAYSAT